MRLERGILLFLLISGCKTAKPVVSEPEFMTFPQDDPHVWSLDSNNERNGLNERMLIRKVHDKSWNIDYGFGPSCNKRKRKELRPKVVEAIDRAVNLWLQPFRDLQSPTSNNIYTPTLDVKKPLPELVNKLNIHEKEKLFPFKIGKQKVYATFDIKKIRGMLAEKNPKGVELILKLPELSVVFNCNKGRPWMQHRFNSINIHEPLKGTHVDANANIPETKFSFASLLHEVGHTFGLADTYVDAKDPARDHMVSTDVNSLTVGHQPISIMSAEQLLNFKNYTSVGPTIDDINGIFWLYTYLHADKLKLDTCPRHYQPEFFARDEKGKPPTVACRPKHPLLFAMASFNYSTARALLLFDKDPSIDINARSHEQGFTALHYAVYAAPIGLVEVILQEYQKEIDFSIAGSDLKGVSPVTVSNWAKFLLWDAQQNNNKQAVERYSVIVDLLLRYGG